MTGFTLGRRRASPWKATWLEVPGPLKPRNRTTQMVRCPLNMPSTKKRARSPEADVRPSTGQSTSVQIYQSVPPKKTRWRGPKDDRLKALDKLYRKRRYATSPCAGKPVTARARQLDTPVRRTAPAFPLQSPALAVPHSPPSLPAAGDEGGPKSSNGPPVSPRVLLPSGLGTAPRVQDNTLFRRTHHLDNYTPAQNQRHNNRATQQQPVSIPPINLAHYVAMESGRLPPPPTPNRHCQHNKEALKVKTECIERACANPSAGESLVLIDLVQQFS